VLAKILGADRGGGKFLIAVAGDVLDLRDEADPGFSFQNNFFVAGGSADAMRAALVRACQDEVIGFLADVPRNRIAVLLV
jgi:hypothetical protein